MLDLKQNIMLNQYHNKNTIEHSKRTIIQQYCHNTGQTLCDSNSIPCWVCHWLCWQ